MKRFGNLLFCMSIAVISVLSLSGCENNSDISSGNSETASTVSTSAVSLSETETTSQTTETEFTETTTAAETKLTETTTTVTETEPPEITRETAAPAELEGDYLQWAQTAADTVYRFLKEDRYHANAPDMNRFGFADLNFDDVPEIIFFDGGMWGGVMTAYNLDGDILYCYNTVLGNYESYIAAVDGETGEKTMLFEAKGGHGFETSHVVFALIYGDMGFREEWIYTQNDELSSHDATVYMGADVIEKSDDCDGLYQKYFGKYEELYRFDSELEMIEVPDRENYSADDVYACVSQVMKKYSENLPQN